jgi:hypothetical protein
VLREQKAAFERARNEAKEDGRATRAPLGFGGAVGAVLLGNLLFALLAWMAYMALKLL